MLRQRVITALALLAVLLPALLLADARPLGLLVLVMVAAGGWEWARLNGLPTGLAWASGALVAGLCGLVWGLSGGVWAPLPPVLWWVASLAWVLGGAAALRAGPQGWPRVPLLLRWLVGVALLCVAGLALMAARARGLNFLLSAFCVVWMSDIAAYFGGRAFGRRKLALSISPGKSWEGVWSGMLGVLLLGWIWMQVDPAASGTGSVFQLLWQPAGALSWALGTVALCGLGVAGDLLESLAKRAVGAKDSSGLLPGHGGVLDRIDALLPVLPAVMALSSL